MTFIAKIGQSISIVCANSRTAALLKLLILFHFMLSLVAVNSENLLESVFVELRISEFLTSRTAI